MGEHDQLCAANQHVWVFPGMLPVPSHRKSPLKGLKVVYLSTSSSFETNAQHWLDDPLIT
jgi:hypothetical protein